MYKFRNGDVVTINPLMDAKKLFKCMFSESGMGNKEVEKFENEIRVAIVRQSRFQVTAKTSPDITGNDTQLKPLETIPFSTGGTWWYPCKFLTLFREA